MLLSGGLPISIEVELPAERTSLTPGRQELPPGSGHEESVRSEGAVSSGGTKPFPVVAQRMWWEETERAMSPQGAMGRRHEPRGRSHGTLGAKGQTVRW